MTETITATLTAAQRDRFTEQGYLVLRQLAPATVLTELQQVAREQLAARQAPLEYESEADYPGLPGLTGQTEGTTVRRLLQAYDRHPAFADWATHERITARVAALLGDDLWLVRNHHNCLMTKHPQGSSRTGWHRDTRYWYFSRPELVNAWLALDGEHPDNGGLHVIPGSQRLDIEPERLDAALFLRDDPRNQALIDSAVALQLEPGDVLLFHSHLLHAAGNNRSEAVKHALVFTYRAGDNPPLADSRSSRQPDVPLG
ncbi:phytanoyl-CoA hydroxylase [Methylohalomonas lacus]|uniref:Phytanoyl-CoA hydroxylase n=1 Tax=Methylohalomonas lacus TaxID=398773 RepID=A0AAE3HME3_9GAMM|nr:phytanoyl-CoA dioxygenase family protein [Methylohalomonas lacus]MCS3903811.1 phytanoyl-CoA hydroxylase [Methylohalomonas lacus]